MREIKFRAWDEEFKVMLPHVVVYDEHNLLILDAIVNESYSEKVLDKRLDSLHDGGPEHYNMLNGFVPMQFTGLQDKNGKDIYEGDILKSLPTMKLDNTVIISEVLFDQKRGTWIANAIKYNEIEYLFEAIKPHHETEIIGNVYEHPELINL